MCARGDAAQQHTGGRVHKERVLMRTHHRAAHEKEVVAGTPFLGRGTTRRPATVELGFEWRLPQVVKRRIAPVGPVSRTSGNALPRAKPSVCCGGAALNGKAGATERAGLD